MIAGRTQKVSFDGVVLSNPMGTDTTRIRIISDQDCFIEIGTSPAAADDGKSVLLEADKPEEFDIGAGDKISVLKVTTAGDLYITENANYFDFEEGLVALYDFSNSSNYTVDGLSRVTAATDLSGKGNDLVNEGTNTGPTIQSSIFGSKSAAHFADTTPARLVTSSNLTTSVYPNNITVVMVVRRMKSAAGPWLVEKTSGGQNFLNWPAHNCVMAWSQPNWPTTKERMPLDVPMIYVMTHDASGNMKHYLGKTGPFVHNTGQLGYTYTTALEKLMIGKSPVHDSSHFKLGLLAVYDKILTDQEISGCVDHINIDLGWGISELSKTHNIIADGNSLTSAWGVGEDSWVVKTCKNLSISQHDITLAAVGGQTLTQMLARPSDYYSSLFRDDLDNNVVVVWEITNELDHGICTEAGTKTKLRDYCEARRAEGYKVIIATCLPRTGVAGMSDGSFETIRLSINQWIRDEYTTPTGSAWMDAYADVGAASGIGALANVSGANYDGSGVHLSLAGHNIVANTIGPVLSGIL